MMPRRRKAASWRKLPTPRPFADGQVKLRDGRRLAFGRFGDPGGRPAYWFHGTPGGRCQLPPDAPDVAREHGFELITVERPGIGESTHHPERTLLSWADDVRQLADNLGHERFAVIGLSGGGPYVLSCCHELPERVVCGISLGGVGPVADPEAPGYKGITPHLMRAMDKLRTPIGHVITHVLKPARVFVSPGFDTYVKYGPQEDRTLFERPEIKAMFCRDITAAIRHSARAPVWDISLFSRPWPFQLENIRVPVTFYHGITDTIVPLSHSEYMAGKIPGAELEVMTELGHFAGFMSAPTVFQKIHGRWIGSAAEDDEEDDEAATLES